MCPVLAGVCGPTSFGGVLVFTLLVHSIHCVLYTSDEADLSIYTSLMVIYIYIDIYIHIHGTHASRVSPRFRLVIRLRRLTRGLTLA